MSSHYTSIVFIGSISALIMIFVIPGNCFMPASKRRLFQTMYALIIAANCAEWYAVFLNGGASYLRIAHIAAKFTEFIIAPFVPLVCIGIFYSLSDRKRLFIPAAINVVLQIYSLFTGAVFGVDGQNLYVHGPLFPLYYITFIFGAAAMFVYCLKFSRKYQYNNFMALSMIIIMIIGAMAIQVTAPQLNLDWTCILYAAIIFYIYYNQLAQQIDNVTSLLNRNSYDFAIETLRKPAAIIFLDVDSFKSVNDKYGHSFGDKCLVCISGEIMSVFENKGYCYRFGGDEFCVIMHKDISSAEKLIMKYRKCVKRLREKDSRIPDVSVGYAVFNPKKETVGEAVKRADKMMYEFKQLHKTVKTQI